MVQLISVTSWRNTWLNYGGFPKRKCWKIKRRIQLMREYLKYSALFHFFTGASLDENQCSERAAAQASPLYLGSHECVRSVCACVCNADRRLPSAALWALRLHGDHTYWTDERSTQIRPRWSNGRCQAERERARNLRSSSDVGARLHAYNFNTDRMQHGTNKRAKSCRGGTENVLIILQLVKL